MTLDDIKSLLEGIPGYGPERVAFWAFPDGEAPPLPFICFIDLPSDNFSADGVVYYSPLPVQIELYTQVKDPAQEALVEAALDGAKIYWEKESGHLDDEDIWMTTYRIEV